MAVVDVRARIAREVADFTTRDTPGWIVRLEVWGALSACGMWDESVTDAELVEVVEDVRALQRRRVPATVVTLAPRVERRTVEWGTP